jgi:hypothetical protein
MSIPRKIQRTPVKAPAIAVTTRESVTKYTIPATNSVARMSQKIWIFFVDITVSSCKNSGEAGKERNPLPRKISLHGEYKAGEVKEYS